MRFVECCIVAVLATPTSVLRAGAQDAAAIPAGVTRHAVAADLTPHLSLDTGRTTLRTHMVRGGVAGAVGGMILSAAALVVVSQTTCPTFTPNPSGVEQGGGCTGLTTGRSVRILLGGIAGGAALGTLLGYEYHATGEEERAARCRATPTACS